MVDSLKGRHRSPLDFSLWLGQFHQYAPVGIGVKETNSADKPLPWLVINQCHPLRFQGLHLSLNIVSLEADVMKPLAAALEKATDGRLCRQRLKQFYIAVANGQAGSSNSLIGQFMMMP